jgi:hypothetical protein
MFGLLLLVGKVCQAALHVSTKVLAEHWVEDRWAAWLRNSGTPKLWQPKYEIVKLS